MNRLSPVVLTSLLFVCVACTKEPAPAKADAPAQTSATTREHEEKTDWCSEHRVPESMCTKCNPSLIPGFVAAGDFCREHGFPESVCPYCHPELAAAGGKGKTAPTEAPSNEAEPAEPNAEVRLASEETEQEAGIRTRKAEKRALSQTLEVIGRLSFNRNRNAELTARGGARVLDVKVDVGDEVNSGQSLLVLASESVGADQAQLAAARARIETARTDFEREQALAQSGVSARRSVEEAKQELAAAQAQFDAAAAALAASGASGSGGGGRYVLTAPFAGEVVGRDAVIGRRASADQVLIQIADVSEMWALLEIPEADSARVRAGQQVTISLDGIPGKALHARIARVSPSVDPTTRTVRARVELPNLNRRLKAGSFLHAKIELGDTHPAVLVPLEAVQQADKGPVVFVKTGKALYESRPVVLGEASEGWVEVLQGLDEGADVVTTGAFLLKTELLKSSIGAGCCATGEE